jgi:hypothetical protein
VESLVSPFLILRDFAECLAHFNGAAHADEPPFSVTLTPRPATRELTFTVASSLLGMQVELCFRMAPCHPLRPPLCTFLRREGIPEGVSKRWEILAVSLLSAASALPDADTASIPSSHPASLASAATVLIQNISSYFEGKESCVICYNVVDPVNHSLPRARCVNCGKKFHANCIYRWFKQAHNHMCPHCWKSFF